MAENKGILLLSAGHSSVKDGLYFDSFLQYVTTRGITTTLLLYQKTDMAALKACEKLMKATTVIPIPLDDAHFGNCDLEYIMRIIFSHILSNNPTHLHIIKSGGTTKMGVILSMVKAGADKLDLPAIYLWAAKNNHGKYCVNIAPDIEVAHGEDFSVGYDLLIDKLLITHPKITNKKQES